MMFHVEPDPSLQTTHCPVCGNSSVRHFLQVDDFFLTNEPFEVLECPLCTHLFTHPQPHPENIGRYYASEKYLSHTAQGKDLISSVYRYIRSINLRGKYRMVSGYRTRGKLLDIGCGTGYLLHHFQSEGWEVTGIEPGKQARDFAIENLGVKVLDEGAIPDLSDTGFDVVSMWHVLEHVHDPLQRMGEVNRLLTPEGIAVIALPNHRSYDARHYGRYWAAWDVPRHLHHFNPKSFAKLADNAGFELLEVKPMRFDAYYVALLSEQYKYHRKRYIAAAFQGFISNFKAHRSRNYSSLVYILRKK